MKKIIVVLICLLLTVSMPLVLSGCDCESNTIVEPHYTGTPLIQMVPELQQQAQEESWSFSVGENAVTSYSLDQLCGFNMPERWWTTAPFDPCIPVDELPTRFDWREQRGVTPVKNQASCGSCWAFGTVGPLECNILIHDGVEVDLAEQWLVSCNQDGWGCQGGWWAHDYFQWKTDSFNGTGAVLEEDFPYQAQNVPCNGPYDHPYRIDSWRLIGFGVGSPSEESIKQAIMDYGPVSSAVAVDSAFGAYTEGVFNHTYDRINHAVVLVGWDDDYEWNGETYGVWFMRNSWGPGWGENGYMNICYDSARIGYAACYVDYPVKTQITVNGGGLGIRLKFTNAHSEPLNRIRWTFSMKGGFFDQMDDYYSGTIDTLAPDNKAYEFIPRIGLGPVHITVTADPTNGGKVTKTMDAFLLGSQLIPLY